MMANIIGLFLGAWLGVQNPAVPPAAALDGVVRDAQGGAVRDAAVSVTCGSHSQTATSNQSGAFRVSNLPRTTCSVTAEAPLFTAHTVDVDLGRGSAKVVLTLR